MFNERTSRIDKNAIKIAAVSVGLLGACDNSWSGENPLKSKTALADAIIRLDPGINDIVPADAVVEQVASGFVFTEGPVWIPGVAPRLYFSDIPDNKLYSWSENGGLETIIDPVFSAAPVAGGMIGSNGLALDPGGRLILCEHGNRRVSRLENDGSRTTLVKNYQGKRLNSPNDIVYHSGGAAYFTDPPYGLDKEDDDPAKELDFNGIYRLDLDGTLTLLSKELARPNGVALSPDEKILYVSNSGWPKNALLMQYPVLDDLSLGAGTLFFDTGHLIGDAYNGTPDGLKVDTAGNVFTTGPGGVLIIDPNGKHLGTIVTSEAAANVGWGDDGRTLYITATTGLYRIRLNTDGLNYRKQ